MSSPKLKIVQGDWFAVPLRTGDYATGVAARANRSGQILGYFFGPAQRSVPVLGDTERYSPSEAVLVCIFSSLKLERRAWPLLGRFQEWNRDEWPMPAFSRFQELNDAHYLQYYDDMNPNMAVRSVVVSAEEAANYPEDGLMGAGFVEARLTRLLASP